MKSTVTEAELSKYRAAKNAAAWCERSAFGVLRGKGIDGLGLLQRLSSNDVGELHVGQGVSTVLLTEKARIIDVATVLRREEDLLFLLSPGTQDEVRRWFASYTIMEDFKLRDISTDWRAVQIIGPQSPYVLQELGGAALDSMTPASWLRVTIFGVETIIVKQAPLCEFSFLLLFAAADEAAFHAGLQALDERLPQLDESVFETLRIEAGQGRHGAEWSLDYNPLEAGLVQLISFTKGCYIGQEVIARLDSYNKVNKRIMGFKGGQPAAPGTALFDGDRVIGRITSTAWSPELQSWLSLGYIRSAYANPAARVPARCDADEIELEIAHLPFTI